MPLIPYVYNPDTHLYYPVTASTSDGLTTLVIGDTGVATAPDYEPTAADPLCDVALYMVVHGLTVLDMSLERWTLLALQASDLVEAYCARSFRVAEADPLLLESDPDYGDKVVTPPPLGLQVAVARLIRALSSATASTNAGMKSESLRNYSYTLSDDVDATNPLSGMQGLFRPYRRLYLFP